MTPPEAVKMSVQSPPFFEYWIVRSAFGELVSQVIVPPSCIVNFSTLPNFKSSICACKPATSPST